MADMFGAPIGIDAARNTNVRELQSALITLKTLEELESAPGERRLRDAQTEQLKAHSRLYGAQADEAEHEAAALRSLSGMRYQGTAERALGAGAREGDVGPTVTNAERLQEPASPVDALYQMGNHLTSRGFLKTGLKVLDSASRIAQQQSSVTANAALEELRKVRTQRGQLEANASLMASAIDQPTYDALRMQLQSQGRDVSAWPSSFAQAQPLLRQQVEQGMHATDVLRAREAEIERRDRQGRNQMYNKVSAARIGALNAQAESARERVRISKKLDGEGSPSTVEARKDMAQIRALRRQELENKLYPLLTSYELKNPSSRTPGKAYTTPNGKKGTWTGTGWLPVADAVVKQQVSAASASTDSALDDDDDDEDDE